MPHELCILAIGRLRGQCVYRGGMQRIQVQSFPDTRASEVHDLKLNGKALGMRLSDVPASRSHRGFGQAVG